VAARLVLQWSLEVRDQSKSKWLAAGSWLIFTPNGVENDEQTRDDEGRC